jgi:hypothetical protein
MEPLKIKMIQSFSELEKCFRINADIMNFVPEKNEWSVLQIIEHVALTNQILIDTMSDENFSGVNNEQQGIIGVRGNFSWPHVSRTEPNGMIDLENLKKMIQKQFADCLRLYERLTKEDIHNQSEYGKSLLAQCLLFLSLHLDRHIKQISRNEKNYFQRLARLKNAA